LGILIYLLTSLRYNARLFFTVSPLLRAVLKPMFEGLCLK